MTTPYQVLKAESRRVGWPRSFVTDLTEHDHKALRTYRPDRFVWLLRETGTQLYCAQMAEQHREWLRNSWVYIELMYHKQHSPGARFYTYDQGTLAEVTSDQAWAFFVDQCMGNPRQIDPDKKRLERELLEAMGRFRYEQRYGPPQYQD
jgi:hypothetical protein